MDLPLKHNNETKDICINFHKIFKTQFNRYIKRVHSDNNSEFLALNTFFWVNVELYIKLPVLTPLNKIWELTGKIVAL